MKDYLFTILLILLPVFKSLSQCVPADVYAVVDDNAVCFEVDDNVRNIYSNNYPDHEDSYNSSFTVEASEEEYSMCAYPLQATEFTPLYEETETPLGCNYTYQFGVALNGIGFTPNSNEYFENTDDGSNNIEWHVEARFLFNGRFGNNGGHLNSFGSYHYHDIPVDYYTDDLGITGSEHSSIVGYAADGFPIYYKYVYEDEDDASSSIISTSSGYSLKSGDRPGDGVSAPDGAYTGLYYEDYEYSDASTVLDECNGRYGVTPDYPYGTYYYVLTDNYPYIPRCFKGTVLDNTFRSLSNCPESTASDDCTAEVQGCMDPFSNNYDSNANVDDGSCSYTITWDGGTSSDWATSSNWDGDELPTSADDVVIPDVVTKPVITSDVEVSTLEIESGATLTVNSSSSLQVDGLLTLNGSLSVASGASLLLLDNVSGSGSSTIHRNTTFSNTQGKYSVIGSPVNSASTSSLGSLVYDYDETLAYDTDGSDRFVLISSPETMSVADAYFSAFTGDISFTGTPNTGDQTVTLVYNTTNDGSAANAGFNLVSNPYSAAISYDALMAENDDLNGTVYIWDDGGSDVEQRTSADYITATSMGAASGGSSRSGDWDGYLRSTQGFFVKATSAGNMTFTPSMMVTTNNSDAGSFRKTEASERSVLKLDLSSPNLHNSILIGFTEEATEAFDRTLDAYKIKGNGKLQFYSRMNNGAIMAIQALPQITEEIVVELGFDISEAGAYSLSIEEEFVDFQTTLTDHQLNKTISFGENRTYEFETEAEINSDRFSLTISPLTTLSTDFEESALIDLTIYSSGDFIHVESQEEIKDATLRIYDVSGHVLRNQKHIDFGREEWKVYLPENGLMILSLQYENKTFTRKFLK